MPTCAVCFIAQLCLTLCDPFDCSPPGSLVHGILRARVLELVTMPSSRDLPNPGTELMSFVSSVLADGFFTSSTTWEPHFTSLCTYGELSNAPLSQRYLHPKTWNLKFSFLGGVGKRDLKNVAKNFEMRSCPALARGALDAITCALLRGRQASKVIWRHRGRD